MPIRKWKKDARTLEKSERKRHRGEQKIQVRGGGRCERRRRGGEARRSETNEVRRWRRRSRAGRVPEAEPSSTAPRATPNSTTYDPLPPPLHPPVRSLVGY